jgi:hypothetical protein
MTRILVCGSRDWSDRDLIETILDGMLERKPLGEPLVIIEGGATGADAIAGDWAEWWQKGAAVEHERHPAPWSEHGRAAGPIRNQMMLDQRHPDVVWAFVTKELEQSRGTADMVRRARQAGVPTYVVRGFRP